MENEKKLSRTETEITKVPAPGWLADYVDKDDSLDSLKEHRVVPRFKVLQATTDDELKRNFGEGSVIVRPGDALICKYDADNTKERGMYFDFVPLFFFVEWNKWRDLKGNGPMILEKSFDPASDLATRSKNVDKRKELYEGHENLDEQAQLYYQYVEHLRFIGVIYGDHPLVGTPVTLSFERGEWGQGKNFISAVSLRREIVNEASVVVPLWAQVWRLRTVHHAPDATRKWYGFSFEAAPQSTINPEEAEPMKSLHAEFKELFDKSRLSVQDDEDTSTDNADASVKANPDF